jgi:hypothetical protein
MPEVKNGNPEYQTAVVGAAPLVKGVLDRLGVAQTIDRFLKHQPEVPTTYGALAQVPTVCAALGFPGVPGLSCPHSSFSLETA